MLYKYAKQELDHFLCDILLWKQGIKKWFRGWGQYCWSNAQSCFSRWCICKQVNNLARPKSFLNQCLKHSFIYRISPVNCRWISRGYRFHLFNESSLAHFLVFILVACLIKFDILFKFVDRIADEKLTQFSFSAVGTCDFNSEYFLNNLFVLVSYFSLLAASTFFIQIFNHFISDLVGWVFFEFDEDVGNVI